MQLPAACWACFSFPDGRRQPYPFDVRQGEPLNGAMPYGMHVMCPVSRSGHMASILGQGSDHPQTMRTVSLPESRRSLGGSRA